MDLNSKIKEALIKMDFVNKYEELSNEYNLERTPQEKWLKNVDQDKVFEIIEKLGYKPKYVRKEHFYKIEEEKVGNFTFGFHIDFRWGSVDWGWIVREGDELLLGSPWSIYSRLLIDPDYKIDYPLFGTYEDLEEIFKRGFAMYEEFKMMVISA